MNGFLGVAVLAGLVGLCAWAWGAAGGASDDSKRQGNATLIAMIMFVFGLVVIWAMFMRTS